MKPSRWRVPFFVRIASINSALFLVIMGGALAMLYQLASRRIVEEFGRKLVAVAESGTLGIDGDAFAALQRADQMESPAYARIRDHLRRLKAANPSVLLRYVYTMAPDQKPGIWRYVVDSEASDSTQFSPLGKTENFSYNPVWSKPLEASLAEDEMRFYPGWGYMISASAPIRDKAGRAVGVLSVDANADTVWSALRTFRRRCLLASAAGVLLCVLLSVPLGWQVTRPLSALIAGTRAVAEGHFQYRVAVARNDEMGDLAQAFNRMSQGLQEREKYRQQFGRYVSHQIAEKILDNPDVEFWGAERRRATILFSDIRGFTSLSEKLPPEEIIGRLNEYLTLMVDIVFRHEGTLDKFIGDAVMAVFGAPATHDNDEERAVRTALEMQKAAAQLADRWNANGLPEFKIGVGIHTGDVVVGNIGSSKRMEYGAIGDTVNLASRLEAMNKEHQTQILISGETHGAVASLIKTRFVGQTQVRGRSQPVDVFEVLGMRDEPA